MTAALIRAQVEAALQDRVLSPFTDRPQQTVEAVPTGIAFLDALTGGLPRGGLTEIFGPDSSGRTSLLHAILGSATGREEECALVDANDTFDPCSAPAAGVDLRRLLWVRCVNLEQTLKATDLLLAGGGFGLVAVDLGSIPPKLGRRVPLASWFRFRRVVEHTPTMLVFLEREPYAKTCASLVMSLEPGVTYWNHGVRDSRFGVRREKRDSGLGARDSQKEPGFGIGGSGFREKRKTGNPKSEIRDLKFETRDLKFEIRQGAPIVSHACLLRGWQPKIEVVRSRLPETSVVSGPLSVVKTCRGGWLPPVSAEAFGPSCNGPRTTDHGHP